MTVLSLGCWETTKGGVVDVGAAVGGGCAEEDGVDLGVVVGGGCAEEDKADMGFVVGGGCAEEEVLVFRCSSIAVGIVGYMEGGTVCRAVVLNKLNRRCWVLVKSITGGSDDGGGGCTEEGNHGIREPHKASKRIWVLSKSIPRD